MLLPLYVVRQKPIGKGELPGCGRSEEAWRTRQKLSKLEVRCFVGKSSLRRVRKSPLREPLPECVIRCCRCHTSCLG